MANPIVTYNSPLKRSRTHFCLFFLTILVTLGFIGFLAFIDQIPQLSAFMGPFANATQPLQTLLAMAFVAVMVPIVFLTFARDYRVPGRLEEFRITRLSSREVALGSIFWGVALSVFVIIAVQMGLLICASLGADLPVANPFSWLGFSGGQSVGVVLTTIYQVFSVLLLLRITRLWLARSSAKWLIFLEPLFWAFIGTGVHITGLILTAPDYWREANLANPITWWMGELLTLALLLLAVVVVGGRAGELYFRTLEPDIYIRHDWFGRERASRKRLSGKLPGLSQLNKIARRLALRNFLIATTGMLVALNLIALALGEGLSLLLRDFPWVIVLVGILAVLAVSARQTWLPGEKRFALVSGRLIRSALFLYLPIVPACLTASGFLITISDEFTRGPMFYYASAINILVCWVMVLFVIPLKGRSINTKCGIALVFIITLSTIILTDSSAMNWIGPIAFFCCDLVVVALAGGLGGLFLQRIHNAEVLNHPIGMLSLEDAPEHSGDMTPTNYKAG